MSAEAQKQVVVMRNNAQALSGALYNRVDRCLNGENDEVIRLKCNSFFCDDLDKCVKASCCCAHILHARYFKRIKNATPSHAASLLYAAWLFVNNQELSVEISPYMKKLFPDSLKKRIGYQMLATQCCVVQSSFWSNICVAVALSITILVIMHVVYRYAYFDAYDNCDRPCKLGNIVNELCSRQIGFHRGRPICLKGTCQVPESGFGLYCKTD